MTLKGHNCNCARKISPVSKLSACKFWEMQCMRNIFKLGSLMEKLEKNVLFSTEN